MSFGFLKRNWSQKEAWQKKLRVCGLQDSSCDFLLVSVSRVFHFSVGRLGKEMASTVQQLKHNGRRTDHVYGILGCQFHNAVVDQKACRKDDGARLQPKQNEEPAATEAEHGCVQCR